MLDLTFDSASIYHYFQDGLGQNLGGVFVQLVKNATFFHFESKVKE
jgi:hypothetical protein